MEFKTIGHFRELGGYATQDGRKIKSGLLYRSGELVHVSEEEQALLGSLNIDTVFDLRSADENKSKPDVSGNYKIISCPLASPARDADERYKNPVSYLDKMKNCDEKRYNYMLYSFAKGYLDFAYNTETISQIIQSLNQHKTILFHCFGGKDRTGVVSMLIMLFLGCDYETCKKDYMLHNEITEKEFALYSGMLEKYQFSDWGKKTGVLSFKAWDFLFDCAYMSIFDLYTSIEDYLEDQFGVDQAQIDDWKDFYLE